MTLQNIVVIVCLTVLERDRDLVLVLCKAAILFPEFIDQWLQ